MTRYNTPQESLLGHSVDSPTGCRIWVGSKTNGYGQMRTQGKAWLAHRLAYTLEVGPIPEGMDLDHTCHIRSCIRVSHLRIVTRKQNLENTKALHGSNKSGIRGVYWAKRDRKWVARVCHNYRMHSAGYFDSLEEAANAVTALRNRLYTHNDADKVRSSQ